MPSSLTNRFCVAGHTFGITFFGKNDNIELLPSFDAFKTENNEDLLFNLVVDGPSGSAIVHELVCNADTGNGITIVERLEDDGYRFTIKNLKDNVCCILNTDKSFSNCQCLLYGNDYMRSFGLNNALMMAFAFAGAKKDTLLVHASLIRQNGNAYAFIAKSGTGKSTHTGLWMSCLPNCDLMNDDNPAIRIINGEPWAFGSPWSGKTPCYRNVSAPLKAIAKIERANSNSIEKLMPFNAFASMLASVSTMKWDAEIHKLTCNTIKRIIETCGVYTLHCLPNREAAEICNKAISRK